MNNWRVQTEMSAEKEKNSYYLAHKTRNRIEELYKADNCSTRSEFVERAVNFYCGYLDAKSADSYLPGVLASTLEGHLNLFADRAGRLLFKMAVEMDMVMNIIAADTDIDLQTLDKLRGKSVRDVKGTNGQIGFKEALKFQKEL